MEKNKVIIIGIDGGTFDIIKPMIEKGELPIFERFMKQGAWGELMSTYPPHTIPAWIACATGVNPGKIGLFDFCKDSHLTYDEGRVVDSTDIKVKPLWGLLSEKGKKVLVAAIPGSNPPMEVNGIIVAPVRVLDSSKIKTYPPEFADELQKKVNVKSSLDKRKKFMEMHKGIVKDDIETFLEATVTSAKMIIDNLTEVILYLLDKNKSDFGMFMLPIDAIQHHLWCYMDKNHPSYRLDIANKYGDAILKSYKWVDQALEKILDKADDDTTIMLVSDHGFGPLKKLFYLNRWLIEKGLLKLKTGRKYIFVVEMISVGRLLHKIGLGFVAKLLSERLKGKKIPIIKKKIKTYSDLIDWKNTKVYATTYALSINLKGREPQGVVKPGDEYESLIEYIKRELCCLKDSDTGQMVVEKVVEKEKLYHGPYVEQAPDVLIFFKDPTYSIRKDLFYPDIFRQLTPDDRMTGHHTSFPNGICMMKGPQIMANCKLKSLNIMDIAPTVMYLLDESVPRGMDGRVVQEAINPEYLKNYPIKISVDSTEAVHQTDIGIQGVSGEDEQSVKNKLRDLGYLG